MLVHESALNHGIEAADAIYAAENWVFAAPQSDDSRMPEFPLGFDSHGWLLELVVLVFDSGNQMLIHAMEGTQAVPSAPAIAPCRSKAAHLAAKRRPE